MMGDRMRFMRLGRVPATVGMLCLLLGRASTVSADDGGIANVGGAATLLKDQGHIRMLSEVVRARVSTKTIEVDCVFVMENHGPADTVLIGFPDRSSGADANASPMRSFRSWVDGVEVPCETLSDAERTGDQQWSYWWTKRVPFAAGSTRVIRDHYVAEPGYSVDGSQTFQYVLETGASWAGTIGSAEIVVTFDGISSHWIRSVDPEPIRDKTGLHWSFRDFEPGSEDGSPKTIDLMWWPPDARKRWVRGGDAE